MKLMKTSIFALILGYSTSGLSQAKVRGNIVTKNAHSLGSSIALKPYGTIDWRKCDPEVLSLKQVKQLSIPVNEPYGFCNQSPPGSFTTFLYTGDLQKGDVNLLMSVNLEDCGEVNKNKYKIWNLKKLLNSSKTTLLGQVEFDGTDYKIITEEPIRAYKTGFNEFRLLVITFDTPKGNKVVALVRNSKREFSLYAEDDNLKSLLTKVQSQFNKIF